MNPPDKTPCGEPPPPAGGGHLPAVANRPLRIYWTEEQEDVLRWACRHERGLSLQALGQIGLDAMLQHARDIAKRMGQRGENIPPAIAATLAEAHHAPSAGHKHQAGDSGATEAQRQRENKK